MKKCFACRKEFNGPDSFCDECCSSIKQHVPGSVLKPWLPSKTDEELLDEVELK